MTPARFALALLLAVLMLPTVSHKADARPVEGTVTAEEWAAYRERFVSPEGRVVDDGNGGISHSEGQGYGLLLSFLAGDRASFDLIYTFTRDELMLRDDGLVAWTWEPDATPNVTDINNATDGDILIAYALALAGEGWEEGRYTQAARDLAEAIEPLVFTQGGRTLLLPGSQGYGRGERPDGPVINPSYWVFEAFPVLAELTDAVDWTAVSDGGLSILPEALAGPRRLPPEWLSVATRPAPAEGFPAVFGYNAVRIPLYLARAGVGDPALVQGLAASMLQPDGTAAVVDLTSGEARETLSDAGYRIIPATIACLSEGTALAPDLATFSASLYYPSTLHLLALSHLRSERPECLP